MTRRDNLVRIYSKNEKYLLCVFYRPPNKSNLFWPRLERSFSNALDETNNILAVGDLNVDFMQRLPYQVIRPSPI